MNDTTRYPVRRLTQFEQNILQHLQTIPDRRYQLWQQTEQGLIVGFFYQSLEVSMKEGAEFGKTVPIGWFYQVERDGAIESLLEHQIRVAS